MSVEVWNRTGRVQEHLNADKSWFVEGSSDLQDIYLVRVRDFISQYTRVGSPNMEWVQKVRVYLPLEQLPSHIILVDTPGFNATESRSEILREYNVGQHNCLEEAAISIRDRTRRNGRAPGRYVISRTLLVKGLEFDHAIILNANTMNRKNLYVALTRASRTLTVLGESPILNPE